MKNRMFLTTLMFPFLVIGGERNSDVLGQASAAYYDPMGPHPRRTAGSITPAYFYECPNQVICQVYVHFKAEIKPSSPENIKCDIVMSATKQYPTTAQIFHYIDRRVDEQEIRWSVGEGIIMVGAQSFSATPMLAKVSSGYGINFMSSSNNLKKGTGASNEQTETWLVSKPDRNSLPEMIWYDIYLQFKHADRTFRCVPHGPGILNRG